MVASAFLVVACNGPSAAEPVGEPEEMSVEEFEVAVSEAFAAVIDAPSVVVVTEDYDRQGRLISKTWTDYRSEEGASVRFEPARDEESDPEISAAVETEDYFAAADNRFDEGWTVRDRESDLVPGGRRIQIDDYEVPLLPDDESMRESFTAFRQDMSDGGAIWSASSEADFEGVSQNWEIDPDGSLRGYRFEVSRTDQFGDVPPPGGIEALIKATVQPVRDPAPLPHPGGGEPMDLSAFPLPDEFLPGP